MKSLLFCKMIFKTSKICGTKFKTWDGMVKCMYSLRILELSTYLSNGLSEYVVAVSKDWYEKSRLRYLMMVHNCKYMA